MERRGKALVLVVDDELAARLITRATLEEGGFDVVEAANAAQALALFEDCHPDVVLLDVMLPDGDGVELCEQLRGLPHGRDVPIAMVTGVNDKESIQRAFQSGATDFITKPIAWGTLAHRTRFLLRAHHALRDLALSALRMRLAASVFEASNDAILICDRHNRIISTNPAFTRSTGHPAHEVLGQDPALLFADVGTRIQFQTMWETLTADNAWQGEFTCRRSNGDTFPAWFSMSLYRDAEGEPEHYIALFTDISLRKVQERRIAHLAFHDELTGLPNRRLVADRLAVALAQAKRDDSQVAVLFVDIDRFKNINDSLGHACGDQLLEQVAQRLQGALRGGDTVGRMGGDEFVLLCPGAGHGAAIAARAQAMLAHLAEPYEVMGMRLHVSASMGIACYPDDGDTPEVLVRNADAAMYLAKEQGRNNFQFYAPELNASILSRLKLEMELRRALDAGQFELYYQPKLDMPDGRLNGAEVLIRWRNDEGQLVPPNRFIPVAEECGLIGAIGDWVLAEACRQHAAWRASGLLVPVLAVNVSARQFGQPEFAGNMGRMLTELGTPPGAIELELTESMLMADVRRTAATLEQLKTLGFSIAIDDFGTGFSSLNYLRHFRLDVLKIDQSFVRELLQDRAALAIVQSIIALARALNLRTVAEGVETEPQRALLQEQGCDAMQGYLVARPLPASDFAAWLRAYNKGRGS